MEDHTFSVFVLGFLLGAACTIGAALFVSQPRQPELPGDWTEDFNRKDGTHRHVCVYCKKSFFGHMMRIVCKNCSPK